MTSSFQPQFSITNRMTEAITRIEQARDFPEAAQLSADWVRHVGEQALIRDAHELLHDRTAFGSDSECLKRGDPITGRLMLEFHRMLRRLEKAKR
jgi:hypothetical protein